MKFPKVVLILSIVFAYTTSCNTTSDKPAVHDTVYMEKNRIRSPLLRILPFLKMLLKETSMAMALRNMYGWYLQN